eukprot:GHVN01075428.1.p1 GENE.GHVN01075428.1~~GHVN01075428.1.p1  ORF type:complete len:100 (-),score=15.52 GHVN01075428.1:403-702(-)
MRRSRWGVVYKFMNEVGEVYEYTDNSAALLQIAQWCGSKVRMSLSLWEQDNPTPTDHESLMKLYFIVELRARFFAREEQEQEIVFIAQEPPMKQRWLGV